MNQKLEQHGVDQNMKVVHDEEREKQYDHQVRLPVISNLVTHLELNEEIVPHINQRLPQDYGVIGW